MNLVSTLIAKIPRKLGPEQLFMVTILLVNGGNYLYNLILGRMLGPEAFSDAAILITLLLILSFTWVKRYSSQTIKLTIYTHKTTDIS